VNLKVIEVFGPHDLNYTVGSSGIIGTKKEVQKMKLDLGIMVGAESKAWLVGFKEQVDRLEKLAGNFAASKTGGKVEAVEADAETGEDAADEDDEDFTSAPAKKKGRPKGFKNKAASFDEDDDEEETETEAEDEEESEDEDDEEETDPIDVSQMKKGKTKKITLDQLNDAARKLAAKHGKKGRAHVLAILQKNFSTQSISDIDESDYPKAMKLLGGA
jgi:sRNA-binding protein